MARSARPCGAGAARQRRALLGAAIAWPVCQAIATPDTDRLASAIAEACRPAAPSNARSAGAAAPTGASGLPTPNGLPRPLARFAAGTPGTWDLSHLLPAGTLASQPVQLRVEREASPNGTDRCGPLLPTEDQFPELRLDGRVPHFDGSSAGALQPGASALRLRLVVSSAASDPGAVWVSDPATILVDSPLSVIRHGLDQWPSFAALNLAVQGSAPAGSAPRGRSDLIGQTFSLTPGMFTELADGHGAAASPVAAIQFPCTVRALDPLRRPVLRSVTGERDVLQVEATLLPPIAGEVVIKDLVLRDNRHWRDTGEAGVRLMDQFAGRSLRIERCEFVRCQNAVAGGTRGQTLRIIDCRIVDCGLGARAHGLYVGPQWLEFTGNHVLQSAGNRLARALVSRILGNRFELSDSPGSYLIDLSNGGEVEIGGNLLQYGRLSDNQAATLIAYAAEGPLESPDAGPLVFAADRRFRLVVRNNTVNTTFPGATRLLVLDVQTGRWPDGRPASSWPEPLQLDDNRISATGPLTLALRRGRGSLGPQEQALPGLAARNGLAGGTAAALANVAGDYAGRRFSGHTALGTGSQPHLFTRQGAG